MRASILFTLGLLACSSEAGVAPPKDRGVEPAGEKPGKGDKPSDGKPSTPEGEPLKTVASSLRPRLQWKRYAAFEADLASALELPADALCKEFGSEPCIRGVHLVPLGGHEPFASGVLEPAPEPLATTPTVVERVVLSACSARVELERSEPKLFPFDLAKPPSAEAIEALTTTLYRRFMARDPEPVERTTLSELAEGLNGDEFAKLACFTVGTSSEFLFF